jgi:hypothetical protein
MATYGTYDRPGPFKLTIYGLAIAAGFLIMLYVAREMFREFNPGPVNSARAAERIKTRQELNAKALDALNKGGIIDSNKGLIRLPIVRAMQITVEGYQNPEAALTNLVARAQKAAEPPPQPAFE